jgi:hypothetical protein
MKFIFHLVKFKDKKTRVEIEATDICQAYKKIEKDYPAWQVSMFWPAFTPVPNALKGDPFPSIFNRPANCLQNCLTISHDVCSDARS